MMKEFRAESPLKELQADDNEEYWNYLLDNILAGMGTCFIEDGIGLLLCIVTPTIWNDKAFQLNELAWYVRPQYRGGSTGFRLFKAYTEYGEELKKQNRIKYFTISKITDSPKLDYSKYGFKKIDENWFQ